MDNTKQLTKRDIEDILALTPMQEGMLFHYLKDPAGDQYFEQLSLNISGELDIPIFEKAWNTVIESNPALRTVFRWERTGEPVQIILKRHYLKLLLLDFSDEHFRLTPIKTLLEEAKVKDRREKFDLREVPFRVTLCKLLPDEYEIIISNHHILFDGWSSGIILKEFFRAYDAFTAGKKPGKIVKSNIKEFIETIRNRNTEPERKFWGQYLEGYDSCVELPVKTARRENIHAIHSHQAVLSTRIKESLEEISRKYRVSKAAVLYSAWGILLQRYGNSEDVVFGTTVSGRSTEIEEIENAVGLFINTLPLRVQSSDGKKIEYLLERIGRELREREAFENTPLIDIYKYSSLNHNEDLFDTIIAVENYPLDSLLKEGTGALTVRSFSIAEGTHYSLSVGITIFNHLVVTFAFYKDEFQSDTILSLSAHFSRILDQIAENPGKDIREIEILSPDEKQRLLIDFNRTDTDYPRHKTIHRLFEEQVRRTPHAAALVASNSFYNRSNRSYRSYLTYTELNRRSEHIAAFLQAKGISPRRIAAISVERSVEMVVRILGILKAGGAYLPIDPAYPEERTRYILADSGAFLLDFDSPGGHINRETPEINTSDPAYIIYTSGSTGKPKGVIVEHASAVNILWALQEKYPLRETDTYLLKTSYVFDVSVAELFGWFIGGGRLAILERDSEKDPLKIMDAVAEYSVTHINFVPSMFNVFVEVMSPRLIPKLSSLKYIFLAGEALLPELVRRFDRFGTGIPLENIYGPTEGTVYSAGYSLSRWDRSGTVPIGTPLPNIKLYILDKAGRTQPVWVPGELHIAGAGLARGYLNNPELTAKSFNRSNRSYRTYTLYKTGDLCRWLPDRPTERGAYNIEYLGRIDHQVKIRGFRIELGEIENRLLSHRDVKEAVVMARTADDGDNYLCAYTVGGDTAGLIEYLSRSLPPYMIPAYFVHVPEMPLTATGKIDRKALPLPGSGLTPGRRYTAPRDRQEELLVEIMSGVLEIKKEDISIDDNFFQLGGHSLKATRFTARIHKVLNIQIPISVLFKTPTVRGIRQHIRIAGTGEHPVVDHVEEKEYYPLSTAQERLYALYRFDPGGIAYNMYAAILLEGNLKKEKLEEAFRTLIHRHESFRTTFHIIQDEAVQRIHPAVDFALEILRATGNETVDVIRHFVRPFDLSQAPLLRVGLADLDKDRFLLIVDMHHIISDGASLHVFINEFASLYRGETLQPLHTRYRDFALWEKQRINDDGTLKSQEIYWMNEFEGEIFPLDLPSDFPPPAVPEFGGSSLTFEIREEETLRLKSLALAEGVTLYMVLLSLVNVFLAKTSGREDIVVGSPVSGRGHDDLEQIIGVFVNALALRNFPSRWKSFNQFLKEVAAKTLNAHENRDYPFEYLVEKIAAQGKIGRNPLFNVMFSLQDTGVSQINIPGLKLEPVKQTSRVSKFDLTFYCEEREDRLDFTLEYSTQRFKKERIETFIRDFKNIAASVLDDPAAAIGDIAAFGPVRPLHLAGKAVKPVEQPFTSPADELEEKLAALWSRVLHIDIARISVHDRFFQAGGHSLKAALLGALIHKELNVNIPISIIFDHPSIRELSRSIRGHIRDKEGRRYIPIETSEKREYYPLSSSQRPMFTLYRMDPGSTVYNITGVLEVEGDIDRTAIEKAFTAVIRRHEILRTSFEIIRGESVQVVHDAVDFNISYIAGGTWEQELRRFIRPFDLTRPPLLRVGLVQTGRASRLLIVDMHHIISDGSSLSVFIKEFSALYRGEQLPPLRIQYKDFSQWQKQENERDHALAKQETYWMKEFEGEIPQLELPVDFPPSAVPSFEGRSLTFSIQKEETEKLKNLASDEDTTLYTVLLTFFYVFLFRLSGQEDIVVGSPVAGRKHAELEPLIGMFVNTLALRNYPAPGKTVQTFLAHVKERTFTAWENQDYPFEFLVEKIAASRGGARNPLFNVMFALQNMEIPEISIPGVRLSRHDFENRVSRFDLTFICEERNGGLHFTVEYSTRLFESRSIRRFIEYFKKTVSHGVQSPHTAIAQLEIIPESEKKQVLFDFNRRETDYPTQKTLHRLFEEQAGRTPDAAALSMDNRSNRTYLTYKNLNLQAHRLAALLKEKGLLPGGIGGIEMERSIDLIIGILAILKTGAAYLPLDPAAPPERTRFMLADSNAAVVLKSETISNHPDSADFPLVPDLSSSNLAYVIYTSGSTGNPKGVPITHANLSPLLHWGYKNLGIGPGHIAVQNLSYYFDWSVWEVFITLTTGACLDIVSDEIRLNPLAYIAHMNRNRISVLHVTPTQWEYLVDSKESAGYLKYLFIGAERLTYDLVDRSIAVVPRDCRIFNMYGPTECTIISAVLEIHREDHQRFKTLSSIPIGRAAANFDLFILDQSLNPCPIKVPGELYIAGDGVARGYLNDPQKTGRSYQFYRSYRTYRTGDLCRWLEDGNIEFLGRIDFQVKIRGFRIEPGEIENRLLEHPSVKSSVVLDRTAPGGEKYLCAYIVPVEGVDDSTFTPADLKSYLSRTLPDYMVPPYFIRVDHIPLNPNGKVDRRALPAPVMKDMARSYIPPADEIEENLVRIWERVLGLEKNLISTDSDFFQLGGHSLKATILTTEILKELNVNVPLAEVFTRQTVKELSDYIRQEKKSIYTSIEAVEKREYYPLSSAQKRLYFLQQLDLNSTGYNIPAVLPLGKDIDRHRLEAILKILIARHEGLRTSFIRVDSVPFQRVHDSRDIDFSLDYFEADPAAAVEIAKQYIKPFDLGRAPLVRSGLIRHPDGQFTWITDIHHIVSDGTSHTVLVEDFMSLYRGEELDPPVLRIQYKDFSQWQNRLFRGREIKKQEDFWLEQFPDAAEIPRLQLPADFKRPGVFTFEGANYGFELEEEVALKFKALGAAYGGTLFMNILAALNTLFYKYSGQTDIIIGTGIAGRRHAEVQRIIGMFVNTLGMRNHPAGEKTYRSFLEEVTANCVKAFENQDLQFEELVDKLELERDPSRNPLFDVLTVVQNFGKTAERPAPSLISGPSTAAPSAYRNITSKFDLTFFVHEEGDRVYINIEYYTGIFEPDTIRRMASHFDNIVKAVVQNPSAALKDIDILSLEEKEQVLHEFNNTTVPYPKDETIHELFRQQVARTPDAAALVFEKEWLTYRCLEDNAKRLARYLQTENNVQPDEPVGILMDRSSGRIVAVLGILETGGGYLPINPSFPEARIKSMIDDARIGVVISESRYIKTLNRLQWECPSFHTFLCMDSKNIYLAEEVEKSELMGRKLWEYVGETATDEITGGGWLSSYTGEPIPKEEMDEYGDNILKKLTPLLSPGMRILEIGCASGITMYRIAPKVGFYYGTDLSGVIIEKNKARVKEESHKNIALACLPAHEIDRIEESDFDLVIINSVIQCFHGHNYLRKVLRKAVDLLGEKGYLFIGDVMDQDSRQALIHELIDFKRTNRDKHYKTKTDWSTELFVSRHFFEDLTVEIPGIRNLEFSEKIYTIENELTKFRYDALLTVDKTRIGTTTGPARRKKHKHQHDLGTLELLKTSSPISLPGPRNLAYIMYTSGSTGKQKGVMVEHRNVVRLVKNTRFIRFNPRDRILQTGALEFDASTFEIWGALLNGLSLCLVGKETLLTPAELKRSIRQYEISIIWMSAPLFNQMLETDIGIFKGLRSLLVGGDVLSPSHINRLRSAYPDLDVINGYGPTENTTFSTTFPISREYTDSIPIGMPVTNSTAYILDPHRNPQPVGVPGELYVGGDGVSRGYLNNPDLTAERFIFDRSNRTSILLYKTGDLARWLPDGSIEFQGRFDSQVKIRGYRIELEEIENQLLKHEDIKEVVVVVKGDPAREQKYLAAYFVADIALESPALREYLSFELPDFMIPSYFVQLDRLPLNQNGKIDRIALPEPEARIAVEGNIPPADDLERTLVGIWSEVLGMEKNTISIDADFFQMGGHSLKATVLVSKMHKELDVKVPLAEIFRTPTIEALAQYIRNAAGERFVSVAPVETKEYYPLSAAQKRLYILQQLDPDSTAYNMSMFFRLEGILDKERLEKTFRQLIDRHESLRTSFDTAAGVPVQKIHPDVAFAVEEHPPSFVSRFIRPFRLTAAPLLRVGLMKEEDHKHILAVDMHHIISDGTSLSVLSGEFMQLYAGGGLSPLRVRYRDYSYMQNRLVQSGEIVRQEAYWLEQFTGEIPVLNLPADHPRPALQRFEGRKINSALGERETTALRILALEQGVTLYMLLLSIYNILLSRLGGQEDIVVGTPVAGRRHADLQDIIGMFVNTLALRNFPTGSKTFPEFLHDVKQRSLAAFENQDYQFEDLVEKVAVTRDASRNPLFDVVFALQNMKAAGIEIPGLRLTPYDLETQTAIFDLSLHVYEAGPALELVIEYSTVLFEEETVRRFVRFFEELVHSLLESPTASLSEINILPENEKHHLLVELNATGADYPSSTAAHRLFEEQGAAHPDRVAVIDTGTSYRHITYNRLHKESSRLARLLREKGIGPTAPAALMLDRSVEMIVAILAVLKTGGAYLPIDPAYPEERVRFMLVDSNAAVLLKSETNSIDGNSNDRDSASFPLLLNLEHPDFEKGCLCQGPVSDISSSNLAYIIYTSGSTGRPKGVMIEHASLVNFVYSMFRDYGERFGVSDRGLCLTNFCFDVSVCEIFLPLVFGAALVLLPHYKLFDPAELAGSIVRDAVTFTYLPPGLLKEVYENLAPYKGRVSLNKMLVGVEPIPDFVLEDYSGLHKEMQIVNGYGPTEATICAAAYVYKSRPPEGRRVPIGTPLANMKIFLFDKYRNPVPAGVPGELHIAGTGLARGYLNNPELTAERFCRGAEPSPRLSYRTGDLARWLPDGNIEFIGRVDTQVKVRGYRVELGEIENRLSGHDAVETAVVMARDDKEGDKYLCAYFVSKSAPTAAQLRDYLSEQLPDYMIPHFFVQLEQLPVTSSGKIDRKALPAPDNTPLAEYIAPRDSIEDTLVCIWSEILDVEKNLISTRDNFFQLGGHSLKAAFLISRIHKELNAHIPLSEIFRVPTIENLAKFIRKAAPAPYASVEPAEERDYYPLSSAQKRLYILQQMDAGNTGYNISAMFLLEGELDRTRLEETFRQLIVRHESFRTFFVWGSEGPVQRVHRHVEFEIHRYDSVDTLRQGIRPFDLSKAPLLRVGLTAVEEEKHVLLVDMHHIISDGTSMTVLAGDFMRIYAGEGLPPVGIQYKDFSLRQEAFFRSGEVKKQEAFWLETFKGEIPVLNLPIDHPRPPVQSFEGKTLVFEIDEYHSRLLRISASRQGVTLYMFLLAACNVLLARLTGQDDIIVGTPAAGRRHAELQDIIGLFVNTLAMRNFPGREKSFTKFLDEVKESTLAAFENQDYQFEELVEKVGVGRDAARNPLFDVMFILQNIDSVGIDIPGLMLKPYDRETGTSNFDLTLQGYESDRAVAFSITYSTRLFKEETVKRFISYFTNIVRYAAEFPDTKISEIDIIPDEEKHLLLDEFNRTAVEYPLEKTIHDLFVSQTEQTPDAAALHMSHSSCTSHLTYRQLNLESHRFAACLREKGVHPRAIVALLIERSIELIISMLAVLKAGAAYLPIDPAYPEERVRYMLADSNAALLLKSETCSNDWNRAGSPLVLNFRDLDPGCVSDFDIRISDLNSLSFAYVIYTSGTTGRPKGVPVRHRGVVNLIYSQREVFREGPGSSMSQVANPAFDAMAGEVWPCLSAGAALHIAPEEARFDPVKMQQWLIGRGIAISFQPTLIAEQLLDLAWPEEGVSLRALLTAGDRLTRYPSRLYPFTLYNLYGPTEDTVWTTWAEVSPGQGAEFPPSIGKPVSNHRVYITGPDLELQPIGVPGELCIAGVGLAAGYLNNPELTAEKFYRSNSSYRSVRPCTLYRTGDLARWLPDGPAARGTYNIEFMGRIDNQVKVRGFRIETGEIENRLTSHVDITEAVVILTGDSDLCAYFVSLRPLTVPELREYLSMTLPAYMVPSHFMQLEKIPLTPNGKVDRKLLPVPGSLRPDLARAYVAPDSDLEKTIAEAWKELLRLDQIGIDDNFFDIGGNSLTLLQVNRRLNQVLDIRMPVIDMFRYTTIRSLSQYLEQPGMETGLDRKKRADALERGKSDRQQRLQKRKQITRKTL